jgi:CHRD domain/Secretion system C-terminal sorting domain
MDNQKITLMKKLFLLFFLSLAFYSGFSQYRYFYGSLSGASEVPANASTGAGIVLVKLNTVSNMVELFGNYTGVSSNVSASHIHQGAVGANGGVVLGLTNTGGTSGNLTGTGTLTDPQETELLAGNMYVNVHTVNFPGGEIRAQLTALADGDGLMLNSRLQGSQEMPPNPSVATGEANILLERSTNKVFLTGKFANLTTNISNAHIHVGRTAVNGGVIIGLTFTPGVTSGTLHGTGTFTNDHEDSLINARTYVNVHSTTYPGGEIRGQITTYSQQQFFGGRLSGANEVPANASTARGTVIVRFNTETNELELSGNYEGLSAPISGSHIHTAAAGSNGPVAVNLINSGGTFGVLAVSTTLSDVQETALMAGNMYVNVHSSSFPGGEIRVQLLPGTSGETQYSQVLITGLQEVPANLSTATGLAAVMVDKITGQTYVTGAFSGLSSNVSSAHLHQGAVGTNGGVVMALTIDGNTQGVVSGSQVLTPAQVEAYMNGLLYINIHSVNFPGGEIRAQLGNLVLPVKLAYFNGYRQKNTAILLWEAATEVNAKQYEIEQQNLETGAWMQKAIVPAKESSPATYKAEDLPVFYNQNFANYRLRMVDKDGKAAYSQVVKISFANEESGLILMRNPVSTSLQFVVNGLGSNQKAEAAIIDLNGRKINRSVISGAGNQQINTSALSGGIYMLQVQVGNEIMVKRFLKQ